MGRGSSEVLGKKAFLKISQNSQKNTCATVSNTAKKDLQIFRLATLIKRDPRTEVPEQSVRRSSNNSQNSQEYTYVEFSF